METFVAPAAGTRHRLGMLALLGALSSFGPLSMDIYLPSTPTIAANLHASQSLVQLTLSGCLAGLAIGQLVAGPVSDSRGRKRPLLAGLVAFTVLSVACAAAPGIGALIIFRFLQGMAGAGGVVLSLAIVRDLYTGTELARVLGSLMLVFGLAPVLAGLGGEGAPTVAGVMLAALTVGALPCVLLIAGRRSGAAGGRDPVLDHAAAEAQRVAES
jgi:MFS transporter, DHA1 family, multidrug resistance protein